MRDLFVTFGPAMFAGCCNALSTTAGAGTITVSSAGSFEMTFDTAAGGSLRQFYDRFEDPAGGTDLDLVGSLAGTNSPQGLHNAGIRTVVPATNFNTGSNDTGAKLDPLEVTATRVKLRQESFYQNGPGGPILAGAKGLGDYSIYPGRLALRWNRRTTSAVAYDTEYEEVVVHRLGAGPLNGWTNYFELAAAGAGTGADDFWLAQNETAGAPGARTDFLDIMYKDWSVANGFLATPDLTGQRGQPTPPNASTRIGSRSPTQPSPLLPPRAGARPGTS